jgi:hypothetical protein
MSGDTLFNEPVPTFTINTMTGDNGTILPGGLIEAPIVQYST